MSDRIRIGINGFGRIGRLTLRAAWGRIDATAERALAVPELAPHAQSLRQALREVAAATRSAWATGVPAEALANAVPYMQAFGHTVLAWIWLDVAGCALDNDPQQESLETQGHVGCAKFFFHYELPKIGAWLSVVESRVMTCASFPEEAF